ncbi:hypothetical protein CDAR_556261 [Caerostris darwini]|uniref:Uncharacterized protein n=1 Tax=Caerostris darwini TaxID=1538125 RepID=A0AAV4MCW8_9ARAC|nr:hypothetical protein CDAR_556261 [Caerostris darwini]
MQGIRGWKCCSVTNAWEFNGNAAKRRCKQDSKKGELSDAPEHSQPDGRPKFIQRTTANQQELFQVPWTNGRELRVGVQFPQHSPMRRVWQEINIPQLTLMNPFLGGKGEFLRCFLLLFAGRKVCVRG